MEPELLKSLIDLGGTVVTVGLFLWYLRDRNGRHEKAMSKLVEAVEKNTKVLIKVAQKHKLVKEVDELIL